MSTITVITNLGDLPKVCIDENTLLEKLGFSRKMLYYYRLQGMPCYLLTISHLQYYYILEDVMHWGKFMKRQFAKRDTW